jgi:ribosomal protein S6--L-glutamate ligase
MVRHPPTRKTPIMPETVRLLSERGAMVDVIYPEEQPADLSETRPEHDLYILKAKTELSLSLAGALHAAGAAIVNPYPVTMLLRDKIATFRILQAAGVPVPESYAASRPDQLAPLLDAGPLVIKPYRGSGGEGVRLVRYPDELDHTPLNGEPLFAQRYYEPDGRDRKIYCIGDQLFGVKRVWPARTYEDKLGEPCTITSELSEIALRCGQAFGIDLYGVDIIDSNGTPYVVDVNVLPGFKGVPDAALRLADYIFAAANRHLSGKPMLSAAATKIPA